MESFYCAISNEQKREERISFFISKFWMRDKNFVEQDRGRGRKRVRGERKLGVAEVKQKGMVSSKNTAAGSSRQREAVLLFQGGSTVVGLLVRHI